MNDEILTAHKTLAKTLGSHPLVFGKDPNDGTPTIHHDWIAVDIKFETRVNGWYTKVNHFIFDKKDGTIILKGFQVASRKYKMIQFNRLIIEEKVKILDIINKKYDQIFDNSNVSAH